MAAVFMHAYVQFSTFVYAFDIFSNSETVKVDDGHVFDDGF